MKIIFFILFFIPVLGSAQDFPDSLSWKIELEVVNRGQKQVIVGNSNQLSHINRLIEEKTKKFNPDANISVLMTFAGTNVSLHDTMPAKKVKKFFGSHSILLSECEMFNFYPSLWANPYEGNDQLGVIAEIDQKTPPIQGQGSLRMGGKNYPNKRYACSLVRVLNALDMSIVSINLSPEIDSANIWFFLDVYGKGDPDAVFTLMVRERGTDAIYNNNTFDYYKYDIPLNFTGWKQVGVRYSDMTSTIFRNMNNNRVSGDNGDKKKETKYLQDINYILWSTKDDKVVEMNIDNLMILYNK